MYILELISSPRRLFLELLSLRNKIMTPLLHFRMIKERKAGVEKRLQSLNAMVPFILKGYKKPCGE